MRYSVVRIFPFEDLGAMQAREKDDAKLDKVSVLISGVCLFHCASFPVVWLVGSSVSALTFFPITSYTRFYYFWHCLYPILRCWEAIGLTEIEVQESSQ